MITRGRVWMSLTKEEREQELKAARFRTQMKWLRINVCGERKQSSG